MLLDTVMDACAYLSVKSWTAVPSSQLFWSNRFKWTSLVSLLFQTQQQGQHILKQSQLRSTIKLKTSHVLKRRQETMSIEMQWCQRQITLWSNFARRFLIPATCWRHQGMSQTHTCTREETVVLLLSMHFQSDKINGKVPYLSEFSEEIQAVFA